MECVSMRMDMIERSKLGTFRAGGALVTLAMVPPELFGGETPPRLSELTHVPSEMLHEIINV